MNDVPRMDEQFSKSDLRTRFRTYRRSLSKAEYARRSQAIVERLTALPELDRAGVVHLFHPATADHEVDIRPLIAQLLGAGKRLVLPVVRRFDRRPGGEARLEHLACEDLAALSPNRWGILEPSAGTPVSPEHLDLVLVPALGAGRNGHRVGSGYGYYDEFLSGTPATKVGVLFAACLVPTVPAEPHDVALDLLVTEDEVVRLPSRRP